MWYCAEKVHPGQHFTKYAILGDDICIADSKVAKAYLYHLKTLYYKVRSFRFDAVVGNSAARVQYLSKHFFSKEKERKLLGQERAFILFTNTTESLSY